MYQAVWNDAVLAESDETMLVEGNHYFPTESLKPDPGRTYRRSALGGVHSAQEPHVRWSIDVDAFGDRVESMARSNRLADRSAESVLHPAD